MTQTKQSQPNSAVVGAGVPLAYDGKPHESRFPAASSVSLPNQKSGLIIQNCRHIVWVRQLQSKFFTVSAQRKSDGFPSCYILLPTSLLPSFTEYVGWREGLQMTVTSLFATNAIAHLWESRAFMNVYVYWRIIFAFMILAVIYRQID